MRVRAHAIEGGPPRCVSTTRFGIMPARTQLPPRRRRHRIAGAELTSSTYHALSQRYLLRNLNTMRVIRLRLAGDGARPASTIRSLPLSIQTCCRPVPRYNIRVRRGARYDGTPAAPQGGCSSGPRTGARPAGGTHGHCDPEARRVGGPDGHRRAAVALRDPVRAPRPRRTPSSSGRLHPWILMVNVAGLVLLLVLLGLKLAQLVR